MMNATLHEFLAIVSRKTRKAGRLTQQCSGFIPSLQPSPRHQMTAAGDESSLAMRDEFSIYIDYDHEAHDAARVFQAMAAMIRALQGLDRQLASAVLGDLDSSTRLAGIEAASLRAIVDAIVCFANGTPLENTRLAQATEFVSRSRERVLEYVAGHPTVERREDVAIIRDDIAAIAEQTGVTDLLTYATPQPRLLLEHMEAIGNASEPLSHRDRLEYRSPRTTLWVEERFSLDQDRIEQLLTDRTLQDTLTEVLVVKKPDYLGFSMWQFKYGNKTVEAKVTDTEWLDRFHSREVLLHPGDGIRAQIHALVRYDQEGRLISERYTVVKVLGVIRASLADQPMLPLKGVA
jgi:hypothetical protein